VVLRYERVRVPIAAATAVVLVAGVVLTAVTSDPWPTNDGIALAVLGAYGVVGYVIARADPRNPIGWIFLWLGFFTLADYVNRLYLVLDYREHGGRLPLGGVALFWQGSWSLFPIIVALPAIVLFPDGRVSRGWQKLLYVYAGAAIVFMALSFVGAQRRRFRPGSRRHPRKPPEQRRRAVGRCRLGAGSVLPRLLDRLRVAAGQRVAILVRRPQGSAEVARGR
jgi:hypothetical protein